MTWIWNNSKSKRRTFSRGGGPLPENPPLEIFKRCHWINFCKKKYFAQLSAKVISCKISLNSFWQLRNSVLRHYVCTVLRFHYLAMFILFLFLEMKVSPPGNFFMLFWGSPRYVSFHFWIIRFYSAGFNFYVFLSQVNFD